MSARQEQAGMPVVADLGDFDVRSGNLGERIIFNHWALVIALCVVATLVLGGFAQT